MSELESELLKALKAKAWHDAPKYARLAARKTLDGEDARFCRNHEAAIKAIAKAEGVLK